MSGDGFGQVDAGGACHAVDGFEAACAFAAEDVVNASLREPGCPGQAPLGVHAGMNFEVDGRDGGGMNAAQTKPRWERNS